MAWRLQPADEMPASLQVAGPSAKRRNLGGEGGDEGEGADEGLAAMLLNLKKMSLYQQQTLRSLCSAAWTRYKVPNGSACVVRAREAGQRYSAAVSKKKVGHGLGSPHIHIAMSVLEGVAAIGEAAQMPDERGVLMVLLEELTNKGPLMVDSIFPFFSRRSQPRRGESPPQGGRGGRAAVVASAVPDVPVRRGRPRGRPPSGRSSAARGRPRCP